MVVNMHVPGYSVVTPMGIAIFPPLALQLNAFTDLTLIIHLLGFALQLFDFCTEYRWLVARSDLEILWV